IDWRKGAEHFLALLADADLASNQLNWQWVAGTGTDRSPHRMFNPTVQGKRFDPKGEYIARYVPELAGLPAKEIHDPPPQERRAPPPPPGQAPPPPPLPGSDRRPSGRRGRLARPSKPGIMSA